MRQAYGAYASKAVQELIYEDILLAIRWCSRQVLSTLFWVTLPSAYVLYAETMCFSRLEQHRKALILLIETVKQRLPQLKVRRVQQEYKKRLVSLSRRDKQPGVYA